MLPLKNAKDAIAKNILFYRKQARMSQKELAKMLGVSNSAISNWESGANSIDLDTLFKLCQVLNIDINTAFDYETKISPETLSNEQKQLIEYYNNSDDSGKKFIMTTAEYTASCNEKNKINIKEIKKL